MAETNPQDRIAELELQLEEANKKAAAAEQTNADLTKQLEASRNDVNIQVQARDKDSEMAKKEYFELQEKFEASEKANAELQAKLAGAQTEIKVLSAKAKDAPEKAIFEFEGKAYEMLAQKIKIPVDGTPTELTAADVLASPEAQKYLIGIKSGLIREVK